MMRVASTASSFGKGKNTNKEEKMGVCFIFCWCKKGKDLTCSFLIKCLLVITVFPNRQIGIDFPCPHRHIVNVRVSPWFYKARWSDLI